MIAKQSTDDKHWYALRTTYGRERKAYNYLVAHGCTAFYPTIMREQQINGHMEMREVSRLPNMFFAYGTEESIKNFVYDNKNLPYLRFYYRHTNQGKGTIKVPLVVPESQMRSFKIICDSTAMDVYIHDEEIRKFKSGQKVYITEGEFAGVEGIVARFRGQQRVGVVIDGLLTMTTAYVPTAFLKVVS